MPRNLKLKTTIIGAGRTQRDVAIATAIPENRLSGIIGGVIVARPHERAALARELDLSEPELFGKSIAAHRDSRATV